MYPREVNGDMLLRPMTEGDLPFFLEIRNEVRELMHDNRIFTLDECIEWYHNTHPENYIIAVGSGDVGIMRVRHDKQNRYSAGAGGDVHIDHRRKGYAVRAWNLLIPYLFHIPAINEIFLEILEINKETLHIYLKLGFEIHEYKPEMAKRPQGWLDGFVLTLSQEKWETK